MLTGNVRTSVLLTVALLLATACASNKPYQVELMPAPKICASGTVDPFLVIENIADESDAERINIVGYSAGTRVVIDALDQLSLLHSGVDQPTLQRDLRVGQVILAGSDYDRELFAAALINGLLKVPERLTIYLPNADKALSL